MLDHSIDTNQFVGFICMLLGLIESQDWETFEKLVLSDKHEFQYLSENVSVCPEFNGMTLLHAIVRHDPPIRLLSNMIQFHPAALEKQDCLGRTALHVAAGCGANVRTIKSLVAYSNACTTQDVDGRTPLHFCCDTDCIMFEDGNKPRGPPDFQVVLALLSGSPESVILEDINEQDALECSILSDAPVQLVKLLQRVKTKVLKKRRYNPPPVNTSQIMEGIGV